MAYSQTELDALKAAVASGVAQVTYGGRTVQYRSLAEIEAIIAKMEASLNSAGRTSVTLAKFCRD